MRTPEHVFREYDIRGKSEIDLEDPLVEAIGRAVVTLLREREKGGALRVAVGRDCRLSSDRLFAALVKGLTRAGADVVDIGVGPTPLLYFAAHHLKTEGAVMITGSHNPPEDNGFKLMHRTSTLFGDEIQALRLLIESERFVDSGAGDVSTANVENAYLEAVAAATRLPPSMPKGLRVVVDAGNGAAGPLGVAALSRLQIEIDALHCEMDGRFPHHHPDPTVEKNIAELRERVRATKATLGIAWDGDGDRLGAVDEEGNVIWGDKLMILFGRTVLAEHPGAAILGEVKCSQTLFDDIAAHGGRPIVCRTGHSLIKKRMREEKALLAGEMSGHIFFADRYFGYDDAIYAAVRLIELVAHEQKSPRALLADVPVTSITPELRVDCPDAIKFQVVRRVLDHFKSTYPVLDVDGARIDFGDGAWGLCRASNTGPVLVLRFEARDDARRDAIRADVESAVRRAMSEL
jgi:phosphomannomutase/phosphoglucomutase